MTESKTSPQGRPAAPTGDKIGRAEDIPKLLAMSRWRVILTLRGLLANPCDDRFLQAAIFAGRVQRRSSEWHAQSRDTDLLRLTFTITPQASA